MNKVLIDTNIWVDVILERPAFCAESRGVLMACIEEDVPMLIAATSLKDVFYFAAKSAGAEAGYRAVELIMQLADPAQVDAIVCEKTITLERPNFEDGIVAACALAEQADAIVTRDEKAFHDLDIERYTPEQFWKKLGYRPVSL